MNPHLKSLAYRMLGSVADAEDMVQEAALRLHLQNPAPDHPEAFMYKVVTNLCLDRLRKDKHREGYVGPWLPEPWIEDASPQLEVNEQLSMGFLLLLEQLSPQERVVFVLREGFDFSFKEIAEILDISPANARQRGHRARQRMKSPWPSAAAPAEQQQQTLTALLASVASGSVVDIVALLSEDVVAYADGGGHVSAAIAPVYGRERIAQVTLHLVSKTQAPLQFEFVSMNGGCGLLVTQAGQVHSCVQIDVQGDSITALYILRNPNKLKQFN